MAVAEAAESWLAQTMPLSMSWELNITTVIVAFTSALAFYLIVIRMSDQTKSNTRRVAKLETDLKELAKKIETEIDKVSMSVHGVAAELQVTRERLGAELAQFREHVAREYLEREIFEKVDKRNFEMLTQLKTDLTSAISQLGDRLERYAERLGPARGTRG